MTTEEQLKIYAAYLPYELDGTFTDLPEGNSFRLTGIERDWNDGIEEIKLIGVPGPYGGHTADADLFKPFLWDPSYLTKEIEHEERVFIPIVELAKEFHITSAKSVIKYDDILNHYEYGIQVSCYVDENRYSYFSISGGDLILHNDFRIIQKLLSWHFNIFDIPAGEFIDKATLKTESNDKRQSNSFFRRTRIGSLITERDSI